MAFTLIANWKMNPATWAEAQILAQRYCFLSIPPTVSLILCPPHPWLMSIQACLRPKASILLGGQDCHDRSGGAHTGSVSASMLASCGCRYVLIGHSERRTQYGESPPCLAQKILQALQARITPILCIGEQENEHSQNALESQLAVLQDVPPSASLMVAYEPVWAIGTGQTPPPSRIHETRTLVQRWFQKRQRAAPPILYGGSVTPANAASLRPVCDGFLIGKASLNTDAVQSMLDVFSTP